MILKYENCIFNNTSSIDNGGIIYLSLAGSTDGNTINTNRYNWINKL